MGERRTPRERASERARRRRLTRDDRRATQRITSEEAEALTRRVSSTQISAWNAAGTWEERGHTDWARARLETLVVERGKFDLDGAFAGVAARVIGVKKCEGDASVVMIRGKPRHGFDFETTLEWRASFAEKKEDGDDDDDDDEAAVEVQGTIHIPEFSRDCAEGEECAFEIKVENRKKEHREREDACYAALKKTLRRIHRRRPSTDRRRIVRARVEITNDVTRRRL